MNELGPEAKAVLEAARDCDEPTWEDQARVRAAIAAQLVVGVATVGAGTTAAKLVAAAAKGGASGSAAGAAATASFGVAAKAIVSLTLAGVISVGAATYVAWTPPRTGVRAPVSSPSVPAATPAMRPSAAGDEPVAEHPPAVTTAEQVPPPRSWPPAAQVPVAPPAPVRSVSVTTDVEAEVLLIGEAHSALRGGDAERALALLDEHARRYPAGALDEERDAARIAALCALGRVAEARVAADRFLWLFPDSPHAARIRSSCGATGTSPF